ncbi:unknown [Clostridium sp. CAG:609]|nr:unknown [Clostridium sp. CAG:609]
MIADTTWYVGGMTGENGALSNAKTAYTYEVGANKDATTTVTSKIGLMYVSDYGFAAAPSAWTTILYNYDDATIINENWLYIGLCELTISRRSDDSNLAFAVRDAGDLGGGAVDSSYGSAVRPSFSLLSSIKFTSGEGTAVNPIRVNL